MFFSESLDEDLDCASYVMAHGGEAAVVGFKGEINEGCRISHIL